MSIAHQEDFAQFVRNFRATIKNNMTTYILYSCAEVPSKLREVFLSGGVLGNWVSINNKDN